jgi:hypothetical protein
VFSIHAAIALTHGKCRRPLNGPFCWPAGLLKTISGEDRTIAHTVARSRGVGEFEQQLTRARSRTASARPARRVTAMTNAAARSPTADRLSTGPITTQARTGRSHPDAA